MPTLRIGGFATADKESDVRTLLHPFCCVQRVWHAAGAFQRGFVYFAEIDGDDAAAAAVVRNIDGVKFPNGNKVLASLDSSQPPPPSTASIPALALSRSPPLSAQPVTAVQSLDIGRYRRTPQNSRSRSPARNEREKLKESSGSHLGYVGRAGDLLTGPSMLDTQDKVISSSTVTSMNRKDRSGNSLSFQNFTPLAPADNDVEVPVATIGAPRLLTQAKALRSGYGSAGQRFRVFANAFSLSIPSGEFFHYDVTVSPDTIRCVKRKIFEQWAKDSKVIAETDGEKNLYTAKDLKLPSNGAEFIVVLPDTGCRVQKFKIKIKYASMVDMAAAHEFVENWKGGIEVPRAALNLLQLIMAHRPNVLFTSFHKSTHWGFYEAYNPQFNIQNGLNLARGWRQSVKYTLGELLLNVDVSSTTFYPAESVLILIARLFNRSRIQDVSHIDLAPGSTSFSRVSKFLKNVAVTSTHLDRKYRMRGLARVSPDSAIIERTEGGRCSVTDYFKRQYQISLRYPDLPCVICSEDGKILIPMELLTVKPGQRFMGKLSDIQTAEIIKITAMPSHMRRDRIHEGRDRMHGNASDENSQLDAWGIKIASSMKEFDARLLPAPVVTGARNSSITPHNGGLDFMRERNYKFFHGIPLNAWSIIIFDREGAVLLDAVENLFNELDIECARRGNPIASRNIRSVITYQNRKTVEQCLLEANSLAVSAAADKFMNDYARAQMIFCIMTSKSSVYDEVKFLAETKFNLMTQCLLSTKHFGQRGLARGVQVNLALKINAKLGGINTTVDTDRYLNILGKARSAPTMIMGADITHPPVGVHGGVSIAAVVASIDDTYTVYRATERVQGPRLDVIQDLQGMFKEHIKHFYNRYGFLPARIIFFRDGVSEGQIQEVCLNEINSLKLVLHHFGVSDCKITFVIVGKRHAYRFFPKDSSTFGDKKGNLMAGTIIDSGVTHPSEFDFFLYSHSGIQGTSRPTHYHVLLDENRFTSDEFQQITYNLCYTYARATKSVSLIPAVYYAHLAADRARYHRRGGHICDSESGSVADDEASAIAEFDPVTAAMKKSMYFV
ncbi:Eukaryotic translation initiation factor 2C [Entophlyctis luteolus]|nr:Eukaryotic translation initiation factor 2C [Entophlyctis luteolus]